MMDPKDLLWGVAWSGDKVACIHVCMSIQVFCVPMYMCTYVWHVCVNVYAYVHQCVCAVHVHWGAQQAPSPAPAALGWFMEAGSCMWRPKNASRAYLCGRESLGAAAGLPRNLGIRGGGEGEPRLAPGSQCVHWKGHKVGGQTPWLEPCYQDTFFCF